MSEELEPLSEQARALIGVERARPGASAVEQGRVLEKLVSAKAFAVGGAVVAGGVTKLLVAVAAATVVGAAGGAAVMHASMSAELERLRAEKPVAPKQETAPAQVEKPLAVERPAEPAPVSAPVRPRAVRPAPPPVVIDSAPSVVAVASSLAEESALIEQARTALLKNDFANAKAALAAYRSKFPEGHLLEEQELMSIQVLLAQHHDAEAQAAVRAFRAAHPGSPLIPALDSLSEEP